MELLAETVTDARVKEFLTTPRIGPEQRKAALAAALKGRVPELVLRFLMVVVEKRRQGLLGEIAREYRALVDERMGRVRVDVAISHAPDAALEQEITQALTARLGKTVVPEFRVDPSLIGGMVVRWGDEILDASVRTRASHLRRRLKAAATRGAPAGV